MWTRVPTPPTASTFGSSPAVVDGVAYIASTGRALRLRPVGDDQLLGNAQGVHTTVVGTDRHGQQPPIPTPAVDNGTVYLTNAGPLVGSSSSVLYAFDAAGSTNCSGSPKSCSPLWTASGASGPPAIADGTVYVNGPDGIDAFDAAGSTGCSGAPKVCTPLWSYTAPNFGPFGSPIVANGVLYGTSGASSLGFGLHAWGRPEPAITQACPRCVGPSSRI